MGGGPHLQPSSISPKPQAGEDGCHWRCLGATTSSFGPNERALGVRQVRPGEMIAQGAQLDANPGTRVFNASEIIPSCTFDGDRRPSVHKANPGGLTLLSALCTALPATPGEVYYHFVLCGRHTAPGEFYSPLTGTTTTFACPVAGASGSPHVGRCTPRVDVR